MKNHKNLFVIPLFILIIILVIGSVYYIHTKYESDSMEQSLSQPNTISVATTTVSKNVETYSNMNRGIQFKYPNTWKVVNENSDETIVKIADTAHLPKPDTDQPSNFFLVRTIGDADMRDLEDGSLKADSGWTLSDFGEIPWRTIYNKEKNINIIMSALNTDAQKTEEDILSTFSFIQ